MRRRFGRTWTAIALLATALVAPPAAAVSAAVPQPVTSVTAVSETRDFLGGGRARLFAPHNATFEVFSNGRLLILNAAGGTSNDRFGFEFEAPPGEVLEARTYDGASTDHDQPGRARMAVSGAGHSCNAFGHFTVLDLAYAGDAVERLHLLYEQHCDDVPSPALFGEIRYQLPAADAELFVAPAQAVWPQIHPGVGSRPIPVTLHNPGSEPITLGTPRIEGASARSFSVHGNACTERLQAAASCVVHVRFTPTSAGPHRAELVVPDGTAAGRRTVALAGEGQSGTTSWHMRSEQGDYVGAGESYSYTPREAYVEARGDRHLVYAYVEDGQGEWVAAFRPGEGEQLEAGRTYVDGLVDLRGHGRHCAYTRGHVTVHELAFGPGGLERLSVTFQQRCERGAAALVGSIAYRAAAPAPPLPEVTPVFTDTAGDPHEDNIEALFEDGVTSGFSDGSYRPRQPVTRGQLATLLALTRNLEPASGSAGFTDTAGTTHEAGIEAVVQAGIAGGYGDGSFRPDEPVTRGQMATFLVRAYRLPAGNRSRFRDTAGDVHAAAIDTVAENGVAAGYGDGTYRPGEVVTRGQMATFLVRAGALPPTS